VIAAGATEELQAVARRLRAPVITSVMGRGALAETDPLWLGVLPNRRATQDALEAADVILAVGCRFSHRSTRGLLLNLELRPDQALIQVDLDPRTIGRMHAPALGIVGDARDGLAGILAALPAGAPVTEWDWVALGRAREARSPRYTEVVDGLLRALREALPADGIVVGDQTGLNYWMEWHLPILAPRTFLYPIGSATLGYGVPAAIGAKVACPDRAVVAVVGDGGLLFTVQELATAAKYRLPVVFVVMNDQDYGAIRYLQTRLYGRTGEHTLTGPDVLALARAFGVEPYHAADPAGLRAALDKALAHPGPTLVEVPLAVEPPWEL
jgi:acetolactate synthase-1/2/3 large subunit